MEIVKILGLMEARKNPELNPKISVYEYLEDRYSREGDNLYVSFTQVDKLGINPQSDYKTPLGIYAYTAKYVLDGIGRYDGDMGFLPFAGNSPYANIFNASGNIVNLNTMTKEEMLEYFEKIKKYYFSNLGRRSWKETADTLEAILNYSHRRARNTSPGGIFWYICYEAVYDLPTGKSETVSWNKLMREIGIDGCIDNGAGIIHTSEPNQTVFFSKSVIKNVERRHNKWSKRTKDIGVQYGKQNIEYKENIKREWASATDQEKVEIIGNRKLYRLVTLGLIPSEKNLLDYITQMGTTHPLFFDAPRGIASSRIKLTDRVKEALIKRSVEDFSQLVKHKIKLSDNQFRLAKNVHGIALVMQYLRYAHADENLISHVQSL